MNIHVLDSIQNELLTTQKELLDRLTLLETDYFFDYKKATLYHGILSELEDVNRALNKMQSGMYGITEDTGKYFSIEELQMMPTARYESDIPYFLRRQ